MKRLVCLRAIFATGLNFINFYGLMLCGIMLMFCPAAFAALEKSSKKECAMCHVMWLDVFRTNRETLIKWQPGNVLMKDTQGIVSSEEVCYSCHDGYVEDSRHTVWKYNNHTTFKKPSEKIRIPDTLTLSIKDEIYCGTCHSPHSGGETEPVSSPDDTIPGPMAFLRMRNTDSRMCEACHVDEADYRRTNGHPVHTDKQKIPQNLFDLGSVKAEKKDTVICQTCHRVHGAKGSSITVMDNSRSGLCMACHEQRTITGTPHDFRMTMPGETNIKGQSLSKSGPCGACHVPHASAGPGLWARKMSPGEPVSQRCLLCHGTKPDHPDSKIKGIGLHSHPINIEAVSKGNSKRGRSSITPKLPLFTREGKRLTDGSIQCFTCHNVHQWAPGFPADRGGKNIEGDGSNSFLRIPASRNSALCVECHRDQQPVLSFDHNLTRVAPEAKNIQGMTASVSGPCGACHIPHNAGDKILWAGNGSMDDAPDGRYCLACHRETGVGKAKTVGKNDHPVNEVLKGVHIPPPGRVIDTLPLYNDEGELEGGNRMTCRTCHDPHIWSAGSERTRPYDAREGSNIGAVINIEGDAGNSFLRKPASPTSELCVVCHEDAALIIGTDHDLFVTAPSSKNRMGRTVTESGQCGVCHSVHNSPEKRRLWAQPDGPVSQGRHPMNSACTGCHSKGGAAEGKVPPVSTHASGQLMNNIMTSDNQPTGYIKFFDDNWKEVGVGDLSCSSCHSSHRWDHLVRNQGSGKNIEGDAETSFLRASSDRTVCIDCHGETALWRYTYFHSLEKRKMIKGLRLY